MEESKKEIQDVDTWVGLLETSVAELTNTQASMEVLLHAPSLSGSIGLSFGNVLAGQAKFNAAMQLASNPSIKFNGDLIKFVPFITMFRNNLIKLSRISTLYFQYWNVICPGLCWRQYSHVFSVGCLKIGMRWLCGFLNRVMKLNAML